MINLTYVNVKKTAKNGTKKKSFSCSAKVTNISETVGCSFEFVICAHVLEHLSNPKDLILEMLIKVMAVRLDITIGFQEIPLYLLV